MGRPLLGGVYLHMRGTARLPVIRQATATECGLACIAMVANYLGLASDLVQLRRQFPVSLRGATLQSIAATCGALNLSTRAVRCSISELGKLRTPCLLHWQLNHFVVLKAVNRKHLVIHDPARGLVTERHDLARDAFTGVALEISRGRGFGKTQMPAQLGLGNLMMFDADTRNKFAAGLALALICEVLLLTTPFYLQAVIDQVLGNGDRELLNTLAIGFGVLLLFQVAANTMRRLTFQYLSHVMVFDVSTRVLHRMLKLTLGWFRSRDLGDIQHRVQSLHRVQEFIVHSAPALVLDGLFMMLITALMTVYAPGLTFAAVGVVATWCVWRALVLALSLRLSSDVAMAESSVQTHFLETLRAVQVVKMSNGESARESDWRNLFASNLNARIRLGNLQIVDDALGRLLFQGMRIASIYVLARQGLQGQMSIGMVSAFVAYLGMFIARAGGVVDRVLEFKLLEVPLNRLSDIVFGDEEAESRGGSPASKLPCDVLLDDVGFRYAGSDTPLLCNCSVRVPEFGFTAITGSSGSGKSTLLRLIAGIEQLSSGKLLVGGVALCDWDLRTLREQTATVFQDDCLLKGSVAENIGLFAVERDNERVRQAAADACIAAEIEALPMEYETRIGDLGSSLSNGQKQRILLARALYRRPRLLLLDEATSGLDTALESRVINTITNLKMTRIAVTHSDRMLQSAHEVLWLKNGTLLLSRPELNV